MSANYMKKIFYRKEIAMLEYCAITTLLLLSGSIWGWYSAFVALIHLASIACLIVRKKFFYRRINLSKRNTIICLLVISVYVLNIIIISKDNPLSSWSVFLVIVGAFLIADLIDKCNFIDKYVSVITILAGFSLLFWLLSRTGIVIGDRIIEPGNGEIYRMNLFYIYRDSVGVIESGLNKRNFGIFWEGGAYQAFLNLAILFMVRFKRTIFKFDELYWFKLLVLAITVVTTFSTTGYVLLVINMVIYVLENSQKSSRKRYAIVGVLMVTGVIIINSPAVVNKFNSSSDSYISYLIRVNDQLNGIKAMFVSPLWGLGFNSKRYSEVLLSYGIYANSSGLLIVAQQFGIIYAICYTVIQIVHFNRFCKMNRWTTKILGMIFLILIFSTESLNQNGIFLLFLYSFKTESKTANRKKIKIPKVKIKIFTPQNVNITKMPSKL